MVTTFDLGDAIRQQYYQKLINKAVLTILRKVSIRKKMKLRGTTSRIGNSLFISFPKSPNLNRKVYQIRKKNQNIKLKCITTQILKVMLVPLRFNLPNHCKGNVILDFHVRVSKVAILSYLILLIGHIEITKEGDSIADEFQATENEEYYNLR